MELVVEQSVTPDVACTYKEWEFVVAATSLVIALITSALSRHV